MWVAVVTTALCAIFAALLTAGQVMVARHRAGAAADLAALAAADHGLSGPSAACGLARRVAGAQGRRWCGASCEVRSRISRWWRGPVRSPHGCARARDPRWCPTVAVIAWRSRRGGRRHRGSPATVSAGRGGAERCQRAAGRGGRGAGPDGTYARGLDVGAARVGPGRPVAVPERAARSRTGRSYRVFVGRPRRDAREGAGSGAGEGSAGLRRGGW
ncbi:Rv3654c family TadE-like protein [Streptomyces sp. M19]